MERSSLTLGIEEEYLIVDRETRDLVAEPEAGFLEDLDPTQAGGGRQVHPLGQFGVGDAPVALQDRQDAAVRSVQRTADS